MKKKYILYFSIFYLLAHCQPKNQENSGKNIEEFPLTKIVKDTIIRVDSNIQKRKVDKIIYNRYKASDFYNKAIEVDSNNVPKRLGQLYFPTKLFPTYDIFKKTFIENKYDTFLIRLLSTDLFTFKEPLLFNKKTDKKIYRFTWLRAFHSPVVIRIAEENGNYKLIWKTIQESLDNQRNQLIDTSKVINCKDWEEFQTKINKINYWNLGLGIGFTGLDGSFWILEGVDSKKYHVVVYWSPENEFSDCCLYLLKLTGLIIPENEIY